MPEALHALYLPPAGHPGGAVPTRRALEYVEGVAAGLRRQLGVTVEIYALRPKDAADARVAAAFRRRGVGSLPALLAGGRAYVGCREIEDYYSGRLGSRAAPRGRAPERRSTGGRSSGGFSGDYSGGSSGGSSGGFSGDYAGDYSGGQDGEGGPDDYAAEDELDAYMRSEMLGGGRMGIDVSELGDD